jgi:cytochrome b
MSQSTAEAPPTHRVRVWDLPLRLFHWGLVVAVVGAVACAQIPGVPVEWHARFGYTALALLLFRLVWGFVGGYWSRFSRLRPTPARLRAYLRGAPQPDDHVGHSPVGALATLALLAVLALQVGTGLLADDEIAFVGPLNQLVSTATGLAATEWHKHLGKLLVLVLVALHVAAVLYYLWVRKQNLVAPMVHGDKVLTQPARASRDDGPLRLWGLVLGALAAGAVGWLVLQAG